MYENYAPAGLCKRVKYVFVEILNTVLIDASRLFRASHSNMNFHFTRQHRERFTTAPIMEFVRLNAHRQPQQSFGCHVPVYGFFLYFLFRTMTSFLNTHEVRERIYESFCVFYRMNTFKSIFFFNYYNCFKRHYENRSVLYN